MNRRQNGRKRPVLSCREERPRGSKQTTAERRKDRERRTENQQYPPTGSQHSFGCGCERRDLLLCQLRSQDSLGDSMDADIENQNRAETQKYGTRDGARRISDFTAGCQSQFGSAESEKEQQ